MHFYLKHVAFYRGASAQCGWGPQLMYIYP
jgi:hypothetical protein